MLLHVWSEVSAHFTHYRHIHFHYWCVFPSFVLSFSHRWSAQTYKNRRALCVQCQRGPPPLEPETLRSSWRGKLHSGQPCSITLASATEALLGLSVVSSFCNVMFTRRLWRANRHGTLALITHATCDVLYYTGVRFLAFTHLTDLTYRSISCQVFL